MTPLGNRLTGKRVIGALAAGLMLATTLAACGDDTPSTNSTRAEPTAGSWTPWVVKPADVPVPAPPAANTAAAKAELAEVKRLTNERPPEVVDSINKFGGRFPTKPWTDTMIDIVKSGPKDPPLSSRNYALLSVAMYDAVLAAYHWKYEFNSAAPKGVTTVDPPSADPSYPSEHAAIAGAASRVLAYLYPAQSAQRLDEMADQAADSRVANGTNTRSDVTAGLDLGRAVADKVIAYAKADGSDAKWDGKRPKGIANTTAFWQPPLGTTSPPVEPVAGAWKTWVMTSGSQFRPGPPPAFGSPVFIKAAKVMIYARNHLTPEQEQAVQFYAGVAGTALPAGIVADVSQADIIKAIGGDVAGGGNLQTVPRTARAMALVTVAMADAGVAAWDTKFTYWNPRPDTAIKALGLDPNFKPVIDTPRFPAYMSGSSTYAGSAWSVMDYLFPNDKDAHQKRAEDQAHSRVWAGIHWPYDEIGLPVGQKIGNLVVERAKTDGADKAP
jgi:hypothetical protein